MYNQIPILRLYQDYFMIKLMDLYKTIGIFGVEHYNLGT